MTVTKNGQVKCDSCGKFVKFDEYHGKYTPDSEFSYELIEHFCKECYR